MQYIDFINRTGVYLSFNDFKTCQRVCVVLQQFKTEQEFIDFYLKEGFTAVKVLHNKLKDFDEATKEWQYNKIMVEQAEKDLLSLQGEIVELNSELEGFMAESKTETLVSNQCFIEHVEFLKDAIRTKERQHKDLTAKRHTYSNQKGSAFLKQCALAERKEVSYDIWFFKPSN